MVRSCLLCKSKDLFRQQALKHVPALASMVQTLQEKRSHSIRADVFLDLWSEYVPAAEAERQFATGVDWGRYAELFEYDANEERLYARFLCWYFRRESAWAQALGLIEFCKRNAIVPLRPPQGDHLHYFCKPQ